MAKKKQKKVVVSRQFLLNLANDIYDSKNKTFLRLCNGTLQNGPDPTNPKRPMHCGLGELYFVMTGRQPEDDGVNEDGVVDLAIELSTLPSREKMEKDAAALSDKVVKAIKKLKLPELVEENLINKALNIDADDIGEDNEDAFREALAEIPNTNDDGIEEDVCTVANYKARSKRVAEQLKLAAKLLPE